MPTSLQPAARLLGLSLDGAAVVLRTGTRVIPDLPEIADFIQDADLKLLQFEAESNVNLTWRVHWKDQPVLLSLGPRLTAETHFEDGRPIAGLVDPDKYTRIQQVCAQARSVGVPCPTILAHGQLPELKRSWCLQEPAAGVPLTRMQQQLPSTAQLEIADHLGELLARLHSVNVNACSNQTGAYSPLAGWYTRRITPALDWLVQRDQLSPDLATRARATVLNLLAVLPATSLSPIHGDIIDHNLFIHEHGGHFHISSIIDWELAEQAADPRYSAVLSAWWLAEEDPARRDVFFAVLHSYNQHSSASHRVEAEHIDRVLVLADIAWYVYILPYTCLRERHAVTGRVSALQQAIEAVEHDRPYLSPAWGLREWKR